jgi:phage/plasmid primase-like uncharacterized protein
MSRFGSCYYTTPVIGAGSSAAFGGEQLLVGGGQVLGGEVKLLSPLTLERIADAVVAEGVATADDVAQVVAELYAEAADPTTLRGLPRIVQAWGAKPQPS